MFAVNSRPIAAIAAFASFATVAMADDNRIFITQDSSLAGGFGNTLFVDQSNADSSTVSGSLSSLTDAQQVGAGNEATIEIVGFGGQVALNQTSPAASVSGNSATVDLSGLLASGILTQNGVGNSGVLDISGPRATGLLEQFGDGNSGSVEVTGSDATGRVIQVGNSNVGGVVVSGNGADVTLTQTGNNIVSVPQVVTNGGTVIINQTN